MLESQLLPLNTTFDYECDTCLPSNATHVFLAEPDQMLDPFHINPAFLAIVVTHAVTFLVGVVGNSVVIATWARGGRLRSSTATFLVSLAVADLLLLFLYVPLETLEYFVVTWDASGRICRLSAFVEMLSGMASVLNLVAVSAERFLVIVYPIRARRWCTVSKSRRSLLLVWSLAVLLAAPAVLNKHVYAITYYNNVTSLTAFYCWDKDDQMALALATYQLLALFVLPAALMLCCYFLVMRELWASTKHIQTLVPHKYAANGVRVLNDGHSYLVRWPKNSSESSSLEPRSLELGRSPVQDIRRARKQVIKMLLFIVLVFHVCWGPRLLLNVLMCLHVFSFDQITYSARVASYLLSFIHSALNPFVYGFMSANFRRMMLNSCHAHASHCQAHAGSLQDETSGQLMVNLNNFNFDAIHYSPQSSRSGHAPPVRPSNSDQMPRTHAREPLFSHSF